RYQRSRRERLVTATTVIALRSRHDQRGKRHLGDVETGKAQLWPEELRRVHGALYERDRVRLHPAVENRPGPWIGSHRDADGNVHGRPRRGEWTGTLSC